MGQKHRNLIQQIVSDDNMRLAYHRTCAGKRRSRGYLEYKEFAETNLQQLAQEIERGDYYPGPFRHFMVYEPKPRQISALSFRDRVAQHALCAVIGPIIESTLLPRCFACRSGLGTHAGVKTIQADMRRLGKPLYFLKTDFSGYFYNIDRPVLHELINKKITCNRTRQLIKSMVPPEGKGIAIGSLSSQYFANLYGGVIDRLLQQNLSHKYWARYMDDIVVLDYDTKRLLDTLESIRETAKDDLHLQLSKWTLAPATQGINFLGYRIWPTHKLLRKQSVVRARRKIKVFKKCKDTKALNKFLAAWIGHASWADSYNLLNSLSINSI